MSWFLVIPEPMAYEEMRHARLSDFSHYASAPAVAAENSGLIGPVRVLNMESGWLFEVASETKRTVREVRQS